MSEPWAHSGGHLLVEHLRAVAHMAAVFLSVLEFRLWEIAGGYDACFLREAVTCQCHQ